jgi:hypothetical protein
MPDRDRPYCRLSIKEMVSKHRCINQWVVWLQFLVCFVPNKISFDSWGRNSFMSHHHFSDPSLRIINQFDWFFFKSKISIIPFCLCFPDNRSIASRAFFIALSSSPGFQIKGNKMRLN